jgi:ketosteroid isomerase-like protein
MRITTLRNTRAAALCGALLFGALLPSLGQANASSEIEARNKQAVSQAFERWAAGGTTFFSDILTPDVVWTIKGSGPSAGVYRGVDAFVAEAVRPFVARLSTPVRPVSKQVWADGDHVIIQWDGTGMARDGQPYRNSYAWIFRMRDGKAYEVSAYLDLPAYDDVLQRIPDPA